MKTKVAWFVAGVVLTAGVGAGWAAKKGITTMTADELKWMDVPESHVAQVANVSGDVMKGAYMAFAKVPATVVTPVAGS